MKFNELKLHAGVQEGIDAMGYESLTPVQELSIPIILDKKDIISCAQTGTGKTAAFLLPVMHMIASAPVAKKIQALVIAPTRELVQQIDKQLEGFAYFSGVSSFPVYGGGSGDGFTDQKQALTNGSDVIVATPGRLLSHLALGYVDLSELKYLILDEADRMLDMGFYEDIMRIVKDAPKSRQTLLFSATMPPKIRKLSQAILNRPEEISIAISKPAEKIIQQAFLVHAAGKIKLIEHIFQDSNYKSVIIFSSRKSTVKDVARALQRLKLKAAAISSDLGQKEREDVLLDFRHGKLNILVATDVLSRGIDIDSIELVINYEVPGDGEDYVHRIGRTARANTDGRAITLIEPSEQYNFLQIERLIEKDVEKLMPPTDIDKGFEYKPLASGSSKPSHGKKPFNKKRKFPPKNKSGNQQKKEG
jgi:ATP-dependent RNA helicase RhlE